MSHRERGFTLLRDYDLESSTAAMTAEKGDGDTTTSTNHLLANLSIAVPPHPLHNRPAQGNMSDLLPPDEQRDPKDEHPSANGSHFAIRD